MGEGGLIVRSRGWSAALAQAAADLEDEVWEPLGFLSHTDAHRRYYTQLLADHADLQLCLLDEETDEPVALVNCVPFRFDADLATLPQEGWDWLVETGARGGSGANVLGALAVSVPHRHRSKGYARRMIRELKALAERKGFDAVVVPVRPSVKCEHPMVPMRDYIAWRTASGRCFDPWLRAHVSQGAEVIGVCERSMVVHQDVGFWKKWTDAPFASSSRHAVKGGLTPVEISLDGRTGLYEEPNVWVRYTL